MHHGIHATAALLSLALASTSEAAASDFSIIVRGHVESTTGALPAPFDAIAVGDAAHLVVSVVDSPTTTILGQSSYPIDAESSLMTIGGASLRLSPPSPGNLFVSNDIAGVGDRVSFFSTPPWGTGLILASMDDPTGQLFDSVDLADLLEIEPTAPDGFGVRLLGAASANIGVAVDEFRVARSSAMETLCLGDGSGSPCPCGNLASDGQGCANSTGAGALLAAFGSADPADEFLGFWADQLPPQVPAILFSGTSLQAGTQGFMFGAGLRCTARGLVRHGVTMSSGDGRAAWAPGVVARLGPMVGETHYFQVWYADAAGPCAGETFNGTTTVAVTFE